MTSTTITHKLLSSLKTKGPFTIPWQIAANSYVLEVDQAARYNQLALDCFAFLTAVAQLLKKGDDRIARILAAKPEELALARDALRNTDPLVAMVRPDIVHGVNGELSIIEIETMIGGLGMSAALREAYDAKGYPGVTAGYAALVRDLLQRQRTKRRQEMPAVIVVGAIIPEAKSQYDWEFESLAAYLAPLHIKLVIGRPGGLRVDAGKVFLGDQQLDVIHRFFRWSELNPSDRRTLERINQKQYLPILQPCIELLEEKALMACLHDPTLQPIWREELEIKCFERLIKAVPPTVIVGHAPELTHKLYQAPKTERNYWLKRSSNTWGGKQAYLGSALSNTKWQQVLEAATVDFLRGQLWILQEHREGAIEPINLFDAATQTATPAKDYRGRFNPFVVWAETGPRCIDFRLTARDNPKVHGASDATFLPIHVIKGAS